MYRINHELFDEFNTKQQKMYINYLSENRYLVRFNEISICELLAPLEKTGLEFLKRLAPKNALVDLLYELIYEDCDSLRELNHEDLKEAIEEIYNRG